MEPMPPLTALQLLDTFQRVAPSEIVAQLKIDQADYLESLRIDKSAVRRWKRAFQEQPWD